MERQIGADQLHHIDTLQLSLAQGSFQAGVLAGGGQRAVGAIRQLILTGEDTQIQSAATDTESNRLGIVAVRQGHHSKGGAGRIFIEGGATAQEEVGIVDGDGQEIALQYHGTAGLGNPDIRDNAAGEFKGGVAKDHIGNAQA